VISVLSWLSRIFDYPPLVHFHLHSVLKSPTKDCSLCPSNMARDMKSESIHLSGISRRCADGNGQRGIIEDARKPRKHGITHNLKGAQVQTETEQCKLPYLIIPKNSDNTNTPRGAHGADDRIRTPQRHRSTENDTQTKTERMAGLMDRRRRDQGRWRQKMNSRTSMPIPAPCWGTPEDIRIALSY